MKTEDLNYALPEELIAQYPPQRRDQSRLLVLHRNSGTLEDRRFCDLPDYLRPGDCLVLNDTKVLPARFYVRKLTGSRFEGLFLHEEADGQWQVLLKNARRLKNGQTVELLDRTGNHPWGSAVVTQSDLPGQWRLKPSAPMGAFSILEQIGLAPLPPYIKRGPGSADIAEDLTRYQTIYAQRPGAVAAPTAGLHFDQPLLDRIRQNGVQTASITLHVGMGTFRPVQTSTLDEHPMHEERYEISDLAADIINRTMQAGGRIIAVGTTSVRTLESAAQGRHVRAGGGTTRLLIQPGYAFKIVDAMVTNFHLPKSTLLALVGSFAGLETILRTYRHAIEQKYRFFSYGDAMFMD
ncbi:MAG: tRNA preQ1(34) S-adenosylmethionine ribosyltransferase-isomerase QueA [Planctomycetales bacterium]|nr:tRNA preQ1(34) S-adenosylmethionine ribosyltransferase-isomerase QueA [Planctomycetales bacterium]